MIEIDVATLVFAAIAAVGSVWRIYQNERMYALHCKIHKKRRMKKRKK
jgi:hypothetical protein